MQTYADFFLLEAASGCRPRTGHIDAAPPAVTPAVPLSGRGEAAPLAGGPIGFYHQASQAQGADGRAGTRLR